MHRCNGAETLTSYKVTVHTTTNYLIIAVVHLLEEFEFSFTNVLDLTLKFFGKPAVYSDDEIIL